MNTVFDRKPVRRGRATKNEKMHEFLEREGRPEGAPIRDWIEHWYSQLPPTKQPDIRDGCVPTTSFSTRRPTSSSRCSRCCGQWGTK